MHPSFDFSYVVRHIADEKLFTDLSTVLPLERYMILKVNESVFQVSR